MANKGWTDFSDWLGKTTGLWETSGAKSERDTLKSLRNQFTANNNKLQKLIDANTGVQGAKKALQSGMQNAGNIAASAANQSTQNARNAGMATGAAAALGANTGANTFADAAQNQQQVMQSAMNDQISGQSKVGENLNTASKQTQSVLENQQATDEATGNSARSLINAGVNAAFGAIGGAAMPGGVGGGGSSGLTGLTGVLSGLKK